MLYNALQRGPYRVPGYHDPDQVRIVGLIFRPDTWAAGTVYYRRSDDDYDVVIPTTFTGWYFKAKSPGKSHASTEPTWVFEEGAETPDGASGLIWEAVPYNLMPPSETISSVTVTATHGITISTFSNTDTTCQFTIPAISAAAEAAGYFEITVRATKSNGETIDVTLHFKVAER